MRHRVIEQIIEGNRWRDGEFLCFQTNRHQVEDSLWYRMCVPMIYAHWEGFVVDSLKIMLKYLNSLCLNHDQVKINLLVFSLSDRYKTLSGKQSFEQRIEFTTKFRELLNDTVKFKTKVETRSNLKSEVLKELCRIFNFNFARFSPAVSDIDRLVNIRNSIAHGENSITPDQQNIEKYIDSVTTAIDILTLEIEEFVTAEKYLTNKTG